MRWTSRVCAVLGLAALSTGANAAILVLTSEGNILQVNTSNAVATPFASYGDVPGATDGFSPNALGYNGNAYYTTFGASPVTLYRDGVAVATLATTGGGVAAGDVTGNTYYYIDPDFDLYRVSNISGAPGSHLNELVKNEMTNVAGTFGDMAISGGSMFVSHSDSSLQQFDLDGNLLNTFTGAARRYLGLAFEGGTLYGVALVGSVNQLFRLMISGTTITPQFVGNISLNGSTNLTLTDAAAVPLPAAAWLLMSGLIGFVALGRRRGSAGRSA